MAQNYYWSKSTLSFYPAVIKNSYVNAGTFPEDAVLVDDSVFHSYGLTSAPAGNTRGSGSDGLPAWVATS
ncbi:hypothetical protein MKW11_14655 [Gluconobacter frateurii]|uniref:hypothetical protein n=1 Tax=Gluconobacter frateurii TaxID=38308 RepID=UPI001F060518|nr:hypothetical protein [Gluconobacter frateurii]UMM08406.1 hypothetical protein MKW11_14655 [Gluconobacter frateurii]